MDEAVKCVKRKVFKPSFVGSGSTDKHFGAPLKIDSDLCVSCTHSSVATNIHVSCVCAGRRWDVGELRFRRVHLPIWFIVNSRLFQRMHSVPLDSPSWDSGGANMLQQAGILHGSSSLLSPLIYLLYADTPRTQTFSCIWLSSFLYKAASFICLCYAKLQLPLQL